MANPSINLGNGNWSVKESKLLGSRPIKDKIAPIEFDVTRASTATRVNKQGLIETVNSNIARIDYSSDAKGTLLLEPQSTNLITYSQDFSDSSWNKINSSVVGGFTSPKGDLSAFKLVESIDNGNHILRNSGITTSGETTISIYAKAEQRNKILLFNGSSGYGFDLLNGTTFALSVTTPNSFNITELTNGWFKCSITHSTTNRCSIYILDDFNSFSYAGNGVSGVYVFGAQVEQNSYATSYIPTLTGTTQTRVAETCGGAGSSSSINSEEGVLYADISALGDGGVRMISISDGSVNNQVSFEYSVITNLIRIRLISEGVEQSFYQSTSFDYLQYHKIAILYKLNNFKVFIDGNNFYTDTGSIMPINLNKLSFANANVSAKFEGKTKDLRVYNTALTDSELAILTTI